MNVAEFLISIIEGIGVDRGFCLTGGMAMHINRAAAASSIRMIYCNHEQACVAAANGYATIHNFQRPGLAIVTSGPGVTNTLTALASAFHDSVPLIVLAGQVKTSDINRLGVRSYGAQEVPSLQLVSPLVKAALRYVPDEVDDDALVSALKAAVTGRKGPVFIEVPLDVQAREVRDSASRREDILSAVLQPTRASKSTPCIPLKDLDDRFDSSLRPVLFVGNGTRIAGITRERLRAFMSRLQIPTLTTWPSVGLAGTDHRYHFGCPGGLAPTHSNKILQAADLVIFLGVRGDLLTTGFSPEKFGKRAHRIFFDIDELELGKFAFHENTLTCNLDLSVVFSEIEGVLKPSFAHGDWVKQCEAWRDEDSRAEALAFNADSEMNARNIALVISDAMSEVTFVTTSSGFAIEGFARFFKPKNGCDMIFGGHCLGSMGLGLPNAVGAAAADHRAIVCVEGDGGVMLNLQELLTLQANPRIPLPIIILNNNGYESISRSQKRAFGCEFGASESSGLASPDFKKIADAFGFGYVRVLDLTGLQQAMRDIAQTRARWIVDVIVSRDDYRGPAIVTRFREDGTPYSSDLEDVSWVR